MCITCAEPSREPQHCGAELTVPMHRENLVSKMHREMAADGHAQYAVSLMRQHSLKSLAFARSANKGPHAVLCPLLTPLTVTSTSSNWM
jgi:hypothetical protein